MDYSRLVQSEGQACPPWGKRLILDIENMGLPIHGSQIIAVSFISVGLAMTALVLRLWSRRLQGVSLAFNDYMAIVAMVFAAGMVSLFLLGKIYPRAGDLAGITYLLTMH